MTGTRQICFARPSEPKPSFLIDIDRSSRVEVDGHRSSALCFFCVKCDSPWSMQFLDCIFSVGPDQRQAMSFGEQVVNAVQIHADDFRGSCHIVVLLVKETNNCCRFITSISQHGDCQIVLLCDALQEVHGAFPWVILSSHTDFDCRGNKSVECQDKSAQWFLCRLETMFSMVQVLQPPTVNLRLCIGPCTLVEHDPKVFRVGNQLGDGRLATDHLLDGRTQRRVSQPRLFCQPAQAVKQ